ncbi:MAG TPA: trypsin-like peptidase domain-containing protein [Actinophytocola sp.]|uniref:trypsin-like peptidase domain-containing protein n=1 Tax=Actinophytocola sp. TaxID=1872138 RepID=UPI002DBC0717|nr:trypsin-like peptidase domain-containing protein [Actinophytocola sp.]HEU5472124.1 trypsin-like peptidase domain-containing protein [Actinophytocola sp.]
MSEPSQPDPPGTEQPEPTESPESRDRPDRLGPRPLDRPPADPTAAAVFGRPAGVAGAFAPPPGGLLGTRNAFADLKITLPPPEALATAFRRPPDADEVLQRPPGRPSPDGDGAEDPLWSSENGADPWRDPAAGAVIGPPAVGKDADAAEVPRRPSGALLSLPEVLFGRRVKPTALLLLGLVALLIGSAGGLVGWAVARGGDVLTSDVTLAQVQPGKERPSGSVADIATRVSPGVVSIEVKGGQDAGTGSGVVIDGQGYIVTNDHVVTLAGRAVEGQKITVVFFDGQRAEARMVGRDPKTDLAVIKVEVSNPTVLQLGDSDKLAVGDAVIAIGSPLGLENTVTEGIVSAVHRPVVAGGENGDDPVVYDGIQTDAAINRGNSGGALVDSTGALVGINSVIRTAEGSTGSIGLGFAIPVNSMRRITESLISQGRVKHADLGLSARSVSADTAEGAQVVNVADNGAAKQAGLVEGDVIVKVGDRQVRNAPELTVAVRQYEPGQTVPIVLARQGRELTIQVTLGSD